MLNEVKHPVREREVTIAPEETYDGRIDYEIGASPDEGFGVILAPKYVVVALTPHEPISQGGSLWNLSISSS